MSAIGTRRYGAAVKLAAHRCQNQADSFTVMTLYAPTLRQAEQIAAGLIDQWVTTIDGPGVLDRVLDVFAAEPLEED